MKKKGAGMLMTIILISVCGWVAIVVFVIKPDIVAGAVLCLAGGSAIGLVIAGLMLGKSWLMLRKRMWPDPERVTWRKLYPLGTSFQKDFIHYRYACAGEDLKKGTLVEANLSGRLVEGEPLPESEEINELVYGDVRSATKVNKYGTGILGWPQVDVRKYRYFWLYEMPLGRKID